LLALVLSGLLQLMDLDHPFGIFYRFVIELPALIRLKDSVYPLIWYLLTFDIVLSVLQFTDSDYPFGIFKPLASALFCLFFFSLQILITLLID
jgi:hypothetical protein